MSLKSKTGGSLFLTVEFKCVKVFFGEYIDRGSNEILKKKLVEAPKRLANFGDFSSKKNVSKFDDLGNFFFPAEFVRQMILSQTKS